MNQKEPEQLSERDIAELMRAPDYEYYAPSYKELSDDIVYRDAQLNWANMMLHNKQLKKY